MSIQILVRDDKIYASQLFSVNAFDTDLTIYKRYRCQFEPKSKQWCIPTSVYDSVIDALGDVEELYITNEVWSQIEILKTPKRSIEFQRIPFTKDDLKVQPIMGKAPHEYFQLEDLSKCSSYNRYALFNEQGTGKSWILCNTLELLRKYKDVRKVLIITSGSGTYNIKRELGRFSNYDSSDVRVGGIKNRRPFDDVKSHVVICSYRSFLLVSDEYQEEISNSKNYRKCPIPFRDWLQGDVGIIILDESHNIANPQARQSKAIHLAAPFFQYRYIATGTPADREEKYYSQLKFLDPALVKNFSYFEWLQEYADTGNRFSLYAINYFKPNKLIEMADIVKSVSTRRFADDVLELPEHFIQKIYVELSDEQKEIYQGIVVEKLRAIQEFYGGIDSRAVFNSFPYLSLAIDNPSLLLNHETKLPDNLIRKVEKFKFSNHCKMGALDDLLEKHPNEKIIIWCSHPTVGQELAVILEKRQPYLINGEVKVPKGRTLDEFKADIIADFQASKNRNILIAGIQVLNSSVTIVEANIAIYFDRTWNYTEYNQSIFRIHRIGQQKTVYTYLLIIDNSLDCVRDMNLEDKDFTTKKFGTQQYLDRNTAKMIFEMSSV